MAQANNPCNAYQEEVFATDAALTVFSNCPGCGVGINWHRRRPGPARGMSIGYYYVMSLIDYIRMIYRPAYIY
jgi:hypothetical protein